MFAAAQGFELVVRRGVPLLPALRASRDRIDGIISGSTSNLTANLEPWWGDLGGPIPVDVVPYGPADGPEWHIGRSRAVAVLREAVPRTFADLREGDLPSRFVIAWLSRVDVEKGADLALHVLAILRAQGVDAELWVAGSGMPGSAYEAILATKVRVLDLGGYVRWVGALPSQAVKGAFLRAADAFIATFVRPEPFGLVVAEAMACGLPVVVPDTGGPGEVLRNAGLDPLTYPENDTGAAAQRLARLAHDRTWRRTAGETARAAFESRWNASRTGEALERVFQRASAESQRGGVVEKKPAHERRRGAHGPVWSSD
jgi:glycosyltransferase involved in cell wall biosynthesis